MRVNVQIPKRLNEEQRELLEKLAEAMGVSHSVVSDYESGRRKSPGVNVIRKMVDAFIELDIQNGSPVISRYNPNYKLDCIISMEEFPGGIPMDRFIESFGGRNLNPDRVLTKSVFGYTIVDSIKAILSLGSEDYLKIYGSNTERALIFPNVHFLVLPGSGERVISPAIFCLNSSTIRTTVVGVHI